MAENPSLFRVTYSEDCRLVESDITLRDLFAMAALPAIIQGLYVDVARKAKPPETTPQGLAYQFADAMLKEREKRNG